MNINDNNVKILVIDKTNTPEKQYKMFIDMLETAIVGINTVADGMGTAKITAQDLHQSDVDFIITECKDDVFIEQINLLFLVGTLKKIAKQTVAEENLSPAESTIREPICFAIYDPIDDYLIIINLTDITDFDFNQRLFGSFKNAFRQIEKSDVKYIDATTMTYSQAILHFCKKAKTIRDFKDEEPPSKHIH